MARQARREWTDEFTLLCESCGYVIEGLPRDGRCAECGLAIAASLPERRTDAPWFAERRLHAAFRAAGSTIARPWTTLSRLDLTAAAYEPAPALWLALWVLGVLTVRPFLIPLTFTDRVIDPVEALLAPLLSPSGWAASVVLGSLVPPCVLGLNAVEGRGIRTFGARRGFRITRPIARAICRTGSIGWLVALAGAAAAAWAWHVLALYPPGPRQRTSVLVDVHTGAAIAAAAASLPGFLVFETFSYLGLRRCRFANRARPAATRPAPEPGGVETASLS